MSAVELTITDRNGDTHVLLDDDGDHIVIKFVVDNKGFERDITLPPGSFAWDLAIERARRGSAFL